MHAIHSTNDVDKTLAFYQAVFGVGGQVRPFASTGPRSSRIRRARRCASPRSAQGRFQPFDGVRQPERQFQAADVADPGALMMKILVRDIDAIVAAAKVNARS
jgi:hypothetical protein